MNSMLYKKYHRNFVKQFKVGTKIKIYLEIENNCTTTIQRAPYIEFLQIRIIDNLHIRTLMSRNGRLRKDIEIINRR